MKKYSSIIWIVILFASFGGQSKSTNKGSKEKEVAEMVKLSEQDLSKYETAYFASGCFWCVEAIFESVKGVKEAVSGYSGGTEENPTYEQVSYGRTSHAEAVEVYYDPEIISFFELVYLAVSNFC